MVLRETIFQFDCSWIQSHPEFGFGFKALFCHDGVSAVVVTGYMMTHRALLSGLRKLKTTSTLQAVSQISVSLPNTTATALKSFSS